MKRLEGKVAVITGGNSGIGLASAQRLKEEGAKVAITGRSQKTLDEAVKLLGNDILAIQSDVSKAGDIEKVYETVSKKFGKIAATKAAMRSLTRSFASALVERNIRVNAVAPGPIETPIFGRTGLSKEEVEGFASYVLAKVPMKRFGKSEEVASAVAFLASSDASYITGVELNVDGGMGQI